MWSLLYTTFVNMVPLPFLFCYQINSVIYVTYIYCCSKSELEVISCWKWNELRKAYVVGGKWLLFEESVHWVGLKNGVEVARVKHLNMKENPFHLTQGMALKTAGSWGQCCCMLLVVADGGRKTKMNLCLRDFLTSRFNHFCEATISLRWLSPLSYRLQKINKSCQSWTYPVTTGKLWLQAKSHISSLLHLNRWPESNQKHQQEASPL